MAWCPKCKCEYVDGIVTCVDCGSALVDELEKDEPLETEKPAFGEEMGAAGGAAFKELPETEEFAFEEEEPPKKYAPAYMNNAERAEENRSSAYTLLLVGGAGLVVVLLFFFDILPISMSLVSKYMISGVMGVMFVLFIIMGIVSMKNSRVLEKKAGKENNLTQEIKKWCLDNLSESFIDGSYEPGEQTEEEKYFKRFDIIKGLIQKQFMNLDEAYLDRLIDEVYPEIFGE